MDDRERERDLALRVMLEERLGGAVPPDLAARIAAAARQRGAGDRDRLPTPRRRARVVAVRLVIAAGVLLAALLGLLLFFAGSPPAQFIYTLF